MTKLIDNAIYQSAELEEILGQDLFASVCSLVLPGGVFWSPTIIGYLSALGDQALYEIFPDLEKETWEE